MVYWIFFVCLEYFLIYVNITLLPLPSSLQLVTVCCAWTLFFSFLASNLLNSFIIISCSLVSIRKSEPFNSIASLSHQRKALTDTCNLTYISFARSI